ncbi:MAG: tRNA dihydrouridine(20/20a) synthase DusA, partial [Gammaproteobacteria bacterium]|nr:tRNA dihydrouridine(20/20a) synthase DusA [Gammaproteobacteria bacterium]
RLACDNPYRIAQIHHALYPDSALMKRSQLFKQYLDYLMDELSKGIPLSLLVKPIFGLAHGLPGASQWKQKLMKILQTKNANLFSELTLYLQELELITELAL